MACDTRTQFLKVRYETEEFHQNDGDSDIPDGESSQEVHEEEKEHLLSSEEEQLFRSLVDVIDRTNEAPMNQEEEASDEIHASDSGYQVS